MDQPKPAPPNTAPPRHKRITISDVAEALGVTKGTVSRALNGYADINEATRLRVQKKALELGYRPLAHAQAIRTGRVRSLGLVLQVAENDGHRPFLADFLAGITQGVGDEGWTLTVASAGSDADVLDRMNQLLEEQKADGFILPRTLVRDPRIDLLRTQHVPFVLYGRTEDETDCAWYDIRGGRAMHDAVERLVGFGHRRIGFINGGVEFNYSRLRLAGYFEGLAHAGLTSDPALVRSGAVTEAQGAAAAQELMRLPTPPTALICAVDRAALGAYGGLAELGLRAGSDVSIIGYDGIPEGAYAQPPLTTFSVDSRKAGERLAHILIERIRGAAADTLRETDAALLVARASDGPCQWAPQDLAAKIRVPPKHP